MRQAGIADWIFPTTSGGDYAARGGDPVIRDYTGRVVTDSDTFWAHFVAVPWHAWLAPYIAWGLFLVAFFGMVICMMVIFRRQWAENERLQFPLATVYTALIEAPEPGYSFNTLFRSRGMWIGFGVVFSIFVINGLASYHPRVVPSIPLNYDLTGVLSEEPWRYTEWQFKWQRIYFTIIGLMMFVQTRTALSLWVMFLAVQVLRMALGSQQLEISQPMEFDQIFGSLVVFGAIILWVGRHHLIAVLRQMCAAGRPGDPHGRYMPYSLAGWGFVAFEVMLVAWLLAAGAGLFGAISIAGMLTLIFLVLAKVVAETGLTWPLIPVPVSHPMELAATTPLPRATLGSYLFGSMFSSILTHDLRQGVSPYVQHALVIADRSVYGQTKSWRKAIPFIGLIIVSLFVAYTVSGASMLYVEYRYQASLDSSNASPLNAWGSQGIVQAVTLDPTLRYQQGISTVRHNRLMHVGIGASITAILGYLRLSFAAWPIHPVGFLMCYTWGVRTIWFSIMIGWAVKSALVHFGGSGLFSRSSGFFIGMIFGEVLGRAFWICVSLALAAMGSQYRAF